MMRRKPPVSETSDAAREEYARRMNAVVLYATAHLDRELSLEQLAREACFSPFHFHRLFTSFTGETPADFVKRLRVEKAASMLWQRASLNITEIGLSCGFSSAAVFSRSFRDILGCSPTAWRLRKNRKVVRKNGKAQMPAEPYLSVVTNLKRQSKGKSTMTVKIKDMAPLRVAYVANMDGYAEEKIGRAWEHLCRWAGARSLLGPGALLLGMSFDNPEVTPAERCRYYACIAIAPGMPVGGEVGAMDIPGGRHAVCEFRGCKKDIAKAYSEFYGVWLPSSGYQPADRPSYEIYRSTPDTRPDGVFEMEICMPIEPLD